jgi:hypothetical protein
MPAHLPEEARQVHVAPDGQLGEQSPDVVQCPELALDDALVEEALVDEAEEVDAPELLAPESGSSDEVAEADEELVPEDDPVAADDPAMLEDPEPADDADALLLDALALVEDPALAHLPALQRRPLKHAPPLQHASPAPPQAALTSIPPSLPAIPPVVAGVEQLPATSAMTRRRDPTTACFMATMPSTIVSRCRPGHASDRPTRRLGAEPSHPARDLVEVDLVEGGADEGAAVRLGDPLRLQGIDHGVEPIEILRVQRDADDLVVARPLPRRRRGWLGVDARRVEGPREHAGHLVPVEHVHRSESQSFFARHHKPPIPLPGLDHAAA